MKTVVRGRYSVSYPETDEEWCAYYERMDRIFNTSSDSPLHHDNRCRIHSQTSSKEN